MTPTQVAPATRGTVRGVRPLLFTGLLLPCVTAGAVSAQVTANASTAAVTTTTSGIVTTYTSGSETTQYIWTAPAVGSNNSLGSIQVIDSASASASHLTLAPFIYSPGGALRLQSAVVQGGSAPSIALTFAAASGVMHVTVKPALDKSMDATTITADAPIVSSIGVNTWDTSLGGRDISVPYYTQPVHYFDSLNLFANIQIDPFSSRATDIYQNSGSYVANTSGVMNTAQETIRIGVSSNIMDVLPYPENPASPYMSQLAGRMMLDVQNGDFATVASSLATLTDYGISNCVVIMHDWQRYGYDNALPTHYSANPSMGGDNPLKEVGAAAKQGSCMFGLHQNYTDYYPNYAGYTAAATARQVDGSQMKAWLNPTTNMQSYVTKPNFFVTNAQTQSPLIHQAYGTNASFIDVNSSATPWWRADMDGTAPGSGMFGTYRDAAKALWAYERNVESGPVFGEGKDHWFWSGLLDGVEAQFGAESTPITNGMQAPLFVDFDLTRIHPLQVNYGMGFYERWMAGGATLSTTEQMDAYRMQEIIFGHAPFLSDALWSSVPRALLEQGLVSPIAARTAQQTVDKISYRVNNTWVDTSTAAKANNFSVAQVHYASGDTFLANESTTPLPDGSTIVVPQYGWIAFGKDFVAGSALLNGLMVDYVQTDTQLYGNARNEGDLLSEGKLAAPEVVQMQQTGPRAIQYQLAWNAYTPDPNDTYTAFVHFVNYQATSDGAGIAAEAEESPAVPSSSWTVGQRVVDGVQQFTLPPSMPDGTYSIRVGLFDSSNRAILYGNDDGTLRYIVGNLTVANSGKTISFTPTPVTVTNTDNRMNNGQVADFGTVRTDGMLSIQSTSSGSNAGTYTMRAYPRYRDVVAEVATSYHAMPTQLTCDDGSTLQPSLTADKTHWQVSLRGKKYCSWH